jgi:hypothetical protein
MAKRLSSSKRTYTLRNAAAVVFALTSVLPMLLFTYSLYALNKLHEGQAQLGLGVALLFALIGGFIFMNLMGRLSELLRFIEEQAAEEETPPTAPNLPTVPATGATSAMTAPAGAPLGASAGAPGPRPGAGAMPASPAARPTGVPPPRPVPTQPPGIVVPGLGTITAARRAATAARHAAGAFDDVQKSMWQAEAQRHLGQRVLVSVKNATEPIQGNLAQIADDGVLLEQNGERVAVSYLRITNIELESKRPA